MTVSNITQVETLLTVKEVMAHLRISRSALYELIRDGKLRTVKWNRKTFFRASTIQAFIEASEQSGPDAAELVRET